MNKVLTLIFIFLLAPSLYGAEEGKSFSTTLSLDHYMGFYTDVDSQSKATITLGKKLNKKASLQLQQGFTKLYVINPGDSELLLADTSLYYHHKLSDIFGLRLGATLPISENSRDNGKITTLSMRLSASKSFFKKLFVSYRPFAGYTFNSYKADIYGNPLTQSNIGNSLLITYSPLKKLTLIAVASAGLGFKEKSIYQSSDETSDSGFYSFDLIGSYALNKKIGFRAGYSQGDAQIRQGVRETYFYDEYNSLYYFGTDISF